MATTAKSENTHKHRNLIDDVLDSFMAIGALLYVLFAKKTGFEIDSETMASLGLGGAAIRTTMRKVLIRLWGDKLGVEADAEAAQEAPVASDDAGSED